MIFSVRIIFIWNCISELMYVVEYKKWRNYRGWIVLELDVTILIEAVGAYAHRDGIVPR